MVVSSRKQQNVDQAVAALQGEGLSVTGTVCHVGKAEDRERLVATVRGQGVEVHRQEDTQSLFLTTQPCRSRDQDGGPEALEHVLRP